LHIFKWVIFTEIDVLPDLRSSGSYCFCTD